MNKSNIKEARSADNNNSVIKHKVASNTFTATTHQKGTHKPDITVIPLFTCCLSVEATIASLGEACSLKKLPHSNQQQCPNQNRAYHVWEKQRWPKGMRKVEEVQERRLQ